MSAVKKTRVIDRIRKLLALSGANNSRGEAESAMLKAQEMLIMHNLSLDDVSDSVESRNVGEVRIRIGGVIKAYYTILACVIAENHRCMLGRTSKIENGKIVCYLCFTGLENDVLVAEHVYNFALITMENLATQYAKEYKIANPKSFIKKQEHKHSYKHGFIAGMRARYKEQVRDNDWGLVLVCDALVIARHEEIFSVKARKQRDVTCRDNKAFTQGYNDGREFVPAPAVGDGCA